MPAGGRPTVRSRRLGSALKRYRLSAKLDQPQAAEVLGVHQTRVSRIESGHVTARIIEIRALLNAYGVDDPKVRIKLETLAKNANRRGWWLEHAAHLRQDYLDHISLEDDATHIREWQPALIPGLLQVPAYAEAVITSAADFIDPNKVPKLVKVRGDRQARIEETEGAANYTAIIWEPVIVHPVVKVEIYQEQLAHIIEVSKRQNVTLQVLPISAGLKATMPSAFSCFSFDTEPTVEAVALDNLRGSSILEGAEDLTAYSLAFDQLRSAALAPDASVKLIRGALRRSKEDSK
ncbi:helix-turn-helix domain-containing protein [Streptomyces hygroscopicus subsp. hygroscopicus]|uniref:helix-turn-helix domain-containing protein n=1 Tax=Streptomyces hygroscopicus TaxID=1912 RepID=UPI001C6567DD|nr:helix-turn-helix transcriptional regulator [Streptomyces hygroscopicus]MBW8087746.1 helix-turn-helix domain-containing protein [Streptomyces hygroscopicus subsp. hygroscopicus]